jgi:hypothetical protein
MCTFCAIEFAVGLAMFSRSQFDIFEHQKMNRYFWSCVWRYDHLMTMDSLEIRVGLFDQELYRIRQARGPSFVQNKWEE